MNLPVQAFAEIVAELRKQPGSRGGGSGSGSGSGSGGSGGGSEQRRATRMAFEAPLTVTTLSTTQASRTLRALMRDISHNGVGLLLSVQLQAADRLVIEFTRTNRPPIRVLAEIKSSRQLADGIFSVGAEFVQVVSETQARALGPAMNEVQRIQQSILCGG